MKAEKQEPKFSPVVITLESQEEVDWMFCLLNHSWLTDDTPLEDGQSALEAFAPNYVPAFRRLCDKIEAKAAEDCKVLRLIKNAGTPSP